MKTINALFVLLASLGSVAQAQGPPQFTISTVAGNAQQANISGTSATLGAPVSVASDPAGNLYFSAQDVVMRLDAATSVLTVVAGNGTIGFSGDKGPATSAQLNRPAGVAIDSTGNLYIADLGNNRIRKVSGGTITTVAGNGTFSFGGDNGPATSAALYFPDGVAVDSSGNLYIADNYNHRIRKVSGGLITTVAGNGTAGFSGDNGPATSAELDYPDAVALDSSGSLYIADYSNGRIRKVSGGVITTVAGGGSSFPGDNAPATSAQLNGPQGVAVDSSGNLYIADTYNNRIRKVSGGVIATIAGSGPVGSSGDNGPATSANLSYPSGVAVDSSGNVYLSDYADSRIRKVSNGTISIVAGNAKLGFSGDSGPATSAQFSQVDDIALDSAGNVYVADYYDNRIRKVSGGTVTTVAGSATFGFSGDNGPATSAELSGPVAVAVDSVGNLYISDHNNNRIRKVSGGTITTVAGNGTGGFSGDNGTATSAELLTPVGIAVDSTGNLYIADTSNNRIRKVSGGVITTVAGNGTFGSSGDNGAATSAELADPYGVAVDTAGNLYIADTVNNRVRKVSGGVITTIAGNGKSGFAGDNGPATSAELNFPTALAVDAAGNVYITDTGNNRVRLVSGGVITTIAGNGTAGFSGDNGAAASAEVDSPIGVAVNSVGSIYISDTYNNRVRLLTPSPTCAYSLSPTSLQPAAAGGSFTVEIQTTAGCSWAVSSLPTWITVSGVTSGSGPATVTLIVASNTSTSALSATISIAGISLAVTEAAASPIIGPSITNAGVTNAASFQTGIAPGGIVTIFGTNLGASAGQVLSASGAPWPQQLAGTNVTMNGIVAPIYNVLNLNGQEQLSVQAPWSLAGATSATVSVITTAGTSPSVTVPVLSAQPGIFILDPASSGATHVNGTVAGASNPASPGEVVVVYLTGLGTVSNQPATGASASLTTLSQTTLTPQVIIGGVSASVAFSGLAPGFIGLYQINATVPTSGVAGLANLTVQANGVTSNTAKIAVQ